MELCVPGSVPLLAALLRRFLEMPAERSSSRLRHAAPGEFTLRAFLNGKLDLSQADAIGRLIHAGGREEARAAYRQVGGRLRREVETIETALTGALALVEAGLDFPDEDIPAISARSVAARVTPIRSRLRALLKSTALRLPERGTLRVVLLGLPNAGKSSLVNALVGRPVALVSRSAGTTRDPVRAFGEHSGRRLEWVDLAGLQESAWLPPIGPGEERSPAPESVEALTRISRRELDTADVVLWVCDGAVIEAEREEAAGFFDEVRRSARAWLRIVSKVDLLSEDERRTWLTGDERAVLVSSRTGEGLRNLLQRVVEISDRSPMAELASNSGDVPGFLLSPIQEAQLLDCGRALDRAEAILQSGEGHELVAVDLREALAALAPLTGREVSERVLGAVFGQFCVGK